MNECVIEIRMKKNEFRQNKALVETRRDLVHDFFGNCSVEYLISMQF